MSGFVTLLTRTGRKNVEFDFKLLPFYWKVGTRSKVSKDGEYRLGYEFRFLQAEILERKLLERVGLRDARLLVCSHGGDASPKI